MEVKKITSVQNEYIKRIAKLKDKKYREEEGLFIAEGEHLVEMALLSHFEVKNIILSDSYYEKCGDRFNIDMTVVPDSVFLKMSDAKTPQGVLSVVRMPENESADFSGRYIYCDNLQDPGNVGTIIRTADAFSFSGVILSVGSADVYSPKVIRSSQGSLFNIKVITGKDISYIKEAKKNGVLITSTALYGESVKLCDMKVTDDQIFVIGNEGSGVSKEILEISDEVAYIPMTGKAESLNAGVAASILMYEVKTRE
ncbi:MAG: RNA methyltransferase [Clostridia bacterium]|nr:RNA methyltransferase [Clostridia bacterium]